MDSKSDANKVWVTKLRHDVRIDELDDTLARHRLRASEVRLLPRGRAVLIFDQTAGKNARTFHTTSAIAVVFNALTLMFCIEKVQKNCREPLAVKHI